MWRPRVANFRVGQIVGICLAAAIVFHSPLASAAQGRTMTTPHPLTSEAEARAQAAKVTALNTLTDKVLVERVTVAGERTPFIWKEYNGRSAWRVQYPDVRLRLSPSAPGFQDRYSRTFSVLLDAATGQLISIVSRFGGTDPDLREQPSGSSAEQQLAAENETYHGLPTRPPRRTFLAVLGIVLNQGIGSPFLAKEIYANYVLHSRRDAPQRAVWIVTLRGLPPLAAHGPAGDQVPIWQRNHMRNVVDDESGTNLFATNSPQPD